MSDRKILNSWKEIAGYLGRGVRTVQRWEAQLGLPVHRPAGKDHSAVLAFSTELDQWLDSRPMREFSGERAALSAESSASIDDFMVKADSILSRIEELASHTERLERKLLTLSDAVAVLQKERTVPPVVSRREIGAAS
jgi:hypothetical protein